jgi:Actin-like ATPase involved in cell division
MRHATGEGRTVLHALPVGYTLDGVKGIRDPRGMVAHQFGVDMNVVTCDATVARNLILPGGTLPHQPRPPWRRAPTPPACRC